VRGGRGGWGGAGGDGGVKERGRAAGASGAAAKGGRGRLRPAHNRRFAKPARQAGDAHRPLGPGHDLAAILSHQEERVVANDYTIRFRNRFYQLLKPVYPGERGGKVVVEVRLDGPLAIRVGGKYLKHRAVEAGQGPGGPRPPDPPEFIALAADARGGGEPDPAAAEGAGSAGVQPTGGRSGRTPAE